MDWSYYEFHPHSIPVAEMEMDNGSSYGCANGLVITQLYCDPNFNKILLWLRNTLFIGTADKVGWFFIIRIHLNDRVYSLGNTSMQ